eukprot:810300-Pleurochrysis_carterae.AAC.1
MPPVARSVEVEPSAWARGVALSRGRKASILPWFLSKWPARCIALACSAERGCRTPPRTNSVSWSGRGFPLGKAYPPTMCFGANGAAASSLRMSSFVERPCRGVLGRTPTLGDAVAGLVNATCG